MYSPIYFLTSRYSNPSPHSLIRGLGNYWVQPVTYQQQRSRAKVINKYAVFVFCFKIHALLCVRQFQPRASPPGQTPGHTGHLKKLFKCPACGQFLLANAPPPVPSVVVKCPALQSIRSIYKVIGCHILINITVSAQENCIKQVTK